MKVLHCIDSGGLYGAERMLLSLMEEQSRIGVEPALLSIGTRKDGNKPIEEETEARGINVERFRMAAGLNPFAALWGAARMVRFAAGRGYDILHSHGYKSNVLLSLVPSRIRKIPLVVTVHGYTGMPGKGRIRLYERLDSFFLRYADRVVVVSRAMATDPHFRKVRPVVIPNGISPFLPAPIPASDEVRNFCGNSFVVGTIGRLSMEKGQIFLIRALERIVRKGVDVKLVIIGEGGERGRLENEAEQLGMKDRLFLAGFRKNAKDYLPLFNVFVLPSMTEGLPISLLEAMLCGVPVVATKVGGIPEILVDGENGQTVEPGREEEIAEAIIGLHDNEESARNIGQVGRSVVMRSYLSSSMANAYLDQYRILLNSDRIQIAKEE